MVPRGLTVGEPFGAAHIDAGRLGVVIGLWQIKGVEFDSGQGPSQILFFRSDVAGMFDGAQQAPTEIRGDQVAGAAEYRNAGNCGRRLHAPEEGRADEKRRSHNAQH